MISFILMKLRGCIRIIFNYSSWIFLIVLLLLIFFNVYFGIIILFMCVYFMWFLSLLLISSIIDSQWLYKKMWNREFNKILKTMTCNLKFDDDSDELITFNFIGYDSEDIKLKQKEIDWINSIIKKEVDEKNVEPNRN